MQKHNIRFHRKKAADLSSFLLRSERKKCSRETGRIEGKGKRGNPSSSPFFPFSPIPFGLEGKGKRDVAVCQFAKKPLLLGEEEKGIYWSVSETEKSTIAGYFLQLGKSRYFFSPSFPTKKLWQAIRGKFLNSDFRKRRRQNIGREKISSYGNMPPPRGV